MTNIVSDIHLCIYARQSTKQTVNDLSRKHRDTVLTKLGVKISEPKTEDDFWAFFEYYTFPKERYDEVKAVVESMEEYSKNNMPFGIDFDYLYEYTENGSITLGSEVRISDPCYDMDTWCAGTLENVLPGTYKCYYQKTGIGRVACIKVVHQDYDPDKYEPMEMQKITVGVDSGTCGIYDIDYFKENCKDDDWYDSLAGITNAKTFDGKAFISRSGYGDGSYRCFVAHNENNDIIAVKILYIVLNEEEYDDE